MMLTKEQIEWVRGHVTGVHWDEEHIQEIGRHLQYEALTQQNDALRWQEITETNLPKEGDEVLRSRPRKDNPRVLEVKNSMLRLFPTAFLWAEQGWTHFRPIDAALTPEQVKP